MIKILLLVRHIIQDVLVKSKMGANFSKRKQKNTEKMTGDSNVISNDEKLCVSNENTSTS
jgi:hypothetical protein